MPFIKGNKLGGRKPMPESVKKILEAAAPEALKVLIELMRNSSDPSIKLKAANIIIERQWGKPIQPIGNDDTGKLVVEWLK
jgi:hypothetical protein